jgi:hypothetical protein
MAGRRGCERPDAGSVGRHLAEHQNTARDDAPAAVIAANRQGRVIDPSHGTWPPSTPAAVPVRQPPEPRPSCRQVPVPPTASRMSHAETPRAHLQCGGTVPTLSPFPWGAFFAKNPHIALAFRACLRDTHTVIFSSRSGFRITVMRHIGNRYPASTQRGPTASLLRLFKKNVAAPTPPPHIFCVNRCSSSSCDLKSGSLHAVSGGGDLSVFRPGSGNVFSAISAGISKRRKKGCTDE